MEYIYGAHCLCNTDVIAMPNYRNSMKWSWFEFELCICLGKKEKWSCDSLKIWGFVFSFCVCNFSDQICCNRVILKLLKKKVTFKMEVHMLMVKLYHYDNFLCNLRYLGRKNTLLTWTGNSRCLFYMILQKSMFLLEKKITKSVVKYETTLYF